MGFSSGELESGENGTRGSRRNAATPVPRVCTCRAPSCRDVNVRALPSSAATDWRWCNHRVVNWDRLPLVLALICILVVSWIRMPLAYNSWEQLTAGKSSHTCSDRVPKYTFTWVAEASEQPSRHLAEQVYEPPEPKQDATTLFDKLAHLRLPEGLMEGLQNVDWGALMSTGAAGLEVAVLEGRQFVEGLMQSEHVQRLLRNLQVEKVEDGLDSLLEDLGFKEKLPAQLLRERRTLEVVFTPIFAFARERLCGKNRDEEEAALKIALGDKQMKAVIKRFEKVPPTRTMSMSPSTLEGMYENLLEVANVLMNSRPVALSLAVRVELLTREFVDYCLAVLSAVTRYISLINRFHRNKKALFFFAQKTLPKLIKILLLLNRIEALYLDRARSDFAERSQDFRALQKEARQLSAYTTDLVSSLGSIAHGCLAATSPQFQVDFARALSAYDHGQDPITAFQQFLEVPRELLREEESPPQQRQEEHNAVSGKPAGHVQPQMNKLHESTMKGAVTPPGPRRKAVSDRFGQYTSDVSGRNGKHLDCTRLTASEYIDMMRMHLNELQEAGTSHTGETAAASQIEDARLQVVRSVLHRDDNTSTEVRLDPSSVATDGGTLGAGLPLEAFNSFPPRLFTASPTTTSETEPATAGFSDSTHFVDHRPGSRESDTSNVNASNGKDTGVSTSDNADELADVPREGFAEARDGSQ